MSALNTQSFEAALKVHYTDLRIKNLVYRNNPWLAAIPKMEAFGGKMLPLPLQVGVPQGRSAVFLDAQTDKTPGIYKDFQLERIRNYGLAAIQNEVLEASVGNANAFMQAAASEIDGILRALTQDLAGDLYGNGTGVRGTSSGASVPSPADPANWQVVTLDASTDLNTAGAVVPDASLLFQRGDEPGTATERKKITGLEGWLPSTPPGAGDSFFLVDRSTDPTRLAGIRYDGTGETIEEAMIGAGALLFREGGRPDVIFMNPLSYSELIKSLGSKVVYDLMRSSDVADVFFEAVREAVRIHLPSGSAMVVADPNCPYGRAYMLQMDTWKLYSLGMAPKILMTDGLRFLRENNADAVEVRAGYYAQMGCTAPGWNATIALTTT